MLPTDIEIKNGLYLTLNTKPNSTVRTLTTHIDLQIPNSSVINSRKTARAIIDKLSKEHNRIGIDAIIAMILIETVGNDNYGEHNI